MIADARACRHHGDDLARQSPNDARHPVRRVAGVVLYPLVEDPGEPRPQAVGRRPGAQPADGAQPRGDVDWRSSDASPAISGSLLEGNPEIRRVAAQGLAEKSRRRDTNDRERMSLHDQRRADHRRIAPIGALPDVMAQHEHGRRSRRVVFRGEGAPGQCAHAERREIVAGHVLGTQGPRRRVHVLASHADPVAARLKCRDLLELGQLRLQPLEQGKREHSPPILRSPLDAAVGAVADAEQARRVTDGQRLQHDGVDEGEDGRRAADAERQRENGGDREDACGPELPYCVAKLGRQSAQHVLLYALSVYASYVAQAFRPAWTPAGTSAQALRPARSRALDEPEVRYVDHRSPGDPGRVTIVHFDTRSGRRKRITSMNRPRNLTLLTVFLTSLIAIASVAEGERRTPGTRAQAPRAIRALYVTGGGFHEFVKQETILPPAVAKRVNVDWTIDHTAGKSTEVLIERHKNTDWTKDFDVVLYNMSFSFVVDVPWIERLAARASRQRRRRRDPARRGPQLPPFRIQGVGRADGRLQPAARRPAPADGRNGRARTSDHARRARELGDDPRRAVRARAGVAGHDAAGPGVQRRIEEDATRSSGRTRTARPACSSRRWGTTPR